MPQWNLDPCLALAVNAWENLIIWCAFIAVAILIGPALLKLGKKHRRLVAASVVLLAALVAPSTVYAVPPNYPGGACAWMNEHEWPCWIIEAAWCPCTWDDDEEQNVPW